MALVVAGEPEQWLQKHDRPSPQPSSFGLKETIIFEILSLDFLIWLRGKQSFSSRRRGWICLPEDSGLCCEIEGVGPAGAHGCQL